MQTVLTEPISYTDPGVAAPLIADPSGGHIGPRINQGIEDLPCGRGFAALLAAYRAFGERHAATK